MFKFLKDPVEGERWILACPNESEKFRPLVQILTCKSRFTSFVPTRGGERPAGPQSIFLGVKKLYLNQLNPQTRVTEMMISVTRAESQRKNEKKKNKIGLFENFQSEINKRFKYFQVCSNDDDLTLSLTDKLGRKIEQFLHFKKIDSLFDFLFLERVEKYGIEISKNKFSL